MQLVTSGIPNKRHRSPGTDQSSSVIVRRSPRFLPIHKAANQASDTDRTAATRLPFRWLILHRSCSDYRGKLATLDSRPDILYAMRGTSLRDYACVNAEKRRATPRRVQRRALIRQRSTCDCQAQPRFLDLSLNQ